jgi:anthranilate phosphoribosyltransferase
LLNAAAGLVVLDAIPFKAATERAREALSSGAAARVLQSWREAARSKKPVTA